jgi:hypothetical protein
MSEIKNPSTARATIFNSYELSRLDDIQRVLVRITDPAITIHVYRLGYDEKEHAEGQALWATASGLHVPLTHSLSEADRQIAEGSSQQYRDLMRLLDQFENKWFPRVRNALLRYIVSAERQVFVDAFFEDMSQQPEGPLVVGSVKKFMVRYGDLRKSEVAGVSDALAALAKRGLDDGLLDRIHSALAKVDSLEKERPQPKVSLDILAKSAKERREAYERLNLWFIDWTEIFRQELPYNQLKGLGLVAPPRRSPAEPANPEDPTDPIFPT